MACRLRQDDRNHGAQRPVLVFYPHFFPSRLNTRIDDEDLDDLPYPEQAAAAEGHIRLIADSLRQGPDRMMAILSFSFLDALCMDLLRAICRSDRVEELLEDHRVLGSAAGRMDICYALGAVEASTCRDFKTMGKIRNAFAHRVGCETFDDPVVRKHCGKFVGAGMINRFKPEQLIIAGRPKEAFAYQAHGIANRLGIALGDARKGIAPQSGPW